jgi:hypothetical protein
VVTLKINFHSNGKENQNQLTDLIEIAKFIFYYEYTPVQAKVKLLPHDTGVQEINNMRILNG